MSKRGLGFAFLAVALISLTLTAVYNPVAIFAETFGGIKINDLRTEGAMQQASTFEVFITIEYNFTGGSNPAVIQVWVADRATEQVLSTKGKVDQGAFGAVNRHTETPTLLVTASKEGEWLLRAYATISMANESVKDFKDFQVYISPSAISPTSTYQTTTSYTSTSPTISSSHAEQTVTSNVGTSMQTATYITPIQVAPETYVFVALGIVALLAVALGIGFMRRKPEGLISIRKPPKSQRNQK